MPRIEYITRRDYMIFKLVVKGSPYRQAVNAIRQIESQSIEWNWDEKKTFDEWEDEHDTHTPSEDVLVSQDGLQESSDN